MNAENALIGKQLYERVKAAGAGDIRRSELALGQFLIEVNEAHEKFWLEKSAADAADVKAQDAQKNLEALSAEIVSEIRLAEQANEETKVVFYRLFDHANRCGDLLKLAKELVGRDSFAAWVMAKFNLDLDRAEAYIAYADSRESPHSFTTLMQAVDPEGYGSRVDKL